MNLASQVGLRLFLPPSRLRPWLRIVGMSLASQAGLRLLFSVGKAELDIESECLASQVGLRPPDRRCRSRRPTCGVGMNLVSQVGLRLVSVLKTLDDEVLDTSV